MVPDGVGVRTELNPKVWSLRRQPREDVGWNDLEGPVWPLPGRKQEPRRLPGQGVSPALGIFKRVDINAQIEI